MRRRQADRNAHPPPNAHPLRRGRVARLLERLLEGLLDHRCPPERYATPSPPSPPTDPPTDPPAAVNILDILETAPNRTAAQPVAAHRDPSLASRMGAKAFEGGAERNQAMFAAARERQSFQKHMYRKWNTGDVYAPHDLSGVEQKKWKLARKTPSSDVFDTLGINPVTEYKVRRLRNRPPLAR